jgi:hypothetical protein
MSKQTGRNEPCPCGSGKKYKRCHGALRAPPKSILDPESAKFIQRELARAEARRIETERQHGLGRPPVTFEHKGYRLVAVGSELLWSKSWKTFPDFLMDYYKRCLGETWWKEQVARAPEERHALYRDYVLTCEYQRKTIPSPGEVADAPATGAVLSVLWLAYGLYLLQHNVQIQERLLQRLRSDDSVQTYGALYEVFVAATMVYCGFELRLENEGDGNTTHCEFTATSKASGKSYSVEAKVCDPGNLGADRNGDRALRRQLARALRKKASHPRLVFIDLNVTGPDAGADAAEWLMSRARVLRRQERALPHAPPAVVFLTAYPYRYLLESVNVPRLCITEGFKIPHLKFDAVFTSLRAYGDFREEYGAVNRIMNTFCKMQIPVTLDGQPPARAFGSGNRRVLIGERYELPGQDGRILVGELTHGIVMEQEKRVMGVFNVEGLDYVTGSMPITDEELAAYRESPETFFGVKQEQSKRANEPIEFYEWALACYRLTPKERLLEFLAGHPDVERLKDLPQLELAKIYSEAVTLSAMSRAADAALVPQLGGQAIAATGDERFDKTSHE